LANNFITFITLIQPMAKMVFERRRKMTYRRQCRNLCGLKEFCGNSWRLFYCGGQAIQFLLFPLNLRPWDKASLIDVSRSWTATRRCIITTATCFARQASRAPTCPFPNIMSAPLPRVGISSYRGASFRGQKGQSSRKVKLAFYKVQDIWRKTVLQSHNMR
jgi:hypothetical protein